MDHGPVQATLNYIGGKYKALILWHLSGGKMRFTELRQQVGSATPKVLTQQLRAPWGGISRRKPSIW